ncbi:tyrosine-protein phosphatase non-receptor type 23-like [Schistocerca cancellata]|uniref:tyrosine-protein phosphatase non-receptor type 23-like n=1 Tax=Schistocerca cancellata TaxID=274614 RepID=UPI002117867D|nr:tyrosine-protein phosphatase non-receptor type 23-like [Schistocerca cancellata]
MPFALTKMGLTVLLLMLAVLLDKATSSSTIIKVPPIKPGEVNQTIVVNVPPTVDVTRTVQQGNDTSSRLVLQPQPSPTGDCLLSDCDENDVGCDGLPPCGPFCPPEACSRVNCSQCWQAGFGGPCCWSCCSQYTPYTFPQQLLTTPQQTQLRPFFPYPQPVAVPLPQAQPMPFPQLRPMPIPQQQAIPIPQPQPYPLPQPQRVPISQPQPIPIPQPQSIPVPQSQSIPISQPWPVPFPISVSQPYAVPQPIPYPQLQPQRQSQPQEAMYDIPQQCRPIPWWPFLQCPQPPSCGPWYNPGCIPQQPTWPNLCYTVHPC